MTPYYRFPVMGNHPIRKEFVKIELRTLNLGSAQNPAYRCCACGAFTLEHLGLVLRNSLFSVLDIHHFLALHASSLYHSFHLDCSFYVIVYNFRALPNPKYRKENNPLIYLIYV